MVGGCVDLHLHFADILFIAKKSYHWHVTEAHLKLYWIGFVKNPFNIFNHI